MSAFYLTQWEEYYTGKLVLGYVGVTEGQLTSVVIYLMAAFFGPDFWLRTLTVGGVEVRYGTALVSVTIVSSIATVISNLTEIWRYTQRKTIGGGETKSNVSFFEALKGTLAITLLTTTFLVWAYLTDIFLNHPHIFIITYGFLVANFVGRIVIARVCSAPFPAIQRLLFPLALVPISIITKGTLFKEEMFLAVYCVCAIGAYLHFAYYIIQDLCTGLKIRCFHIPTGGSGSKKR